MTALGNTTLMTQHGWQFDFTDNDSNSTDAYKNISTKCGSQAKWYGWSANSTVGTLSVTLQGAGKVRLNFGNCWDNGTVKVYLNDELIATAAVGNKSVVKTFQFTAGSVLKLKDEDGNSVISLNSINFICDGMSYK